MQLTSYKNLHRFILFTCVCTFCLIVAGGLVTSTQSGLSVPDWPSTYGHFMFAFPLDQMAGGIFYEHSHRMIASFVGFLTIIAAVWIWKRDDRRWVRWLGVTALGVVIAQGLLGGLTVLFLLPTAVSVAHATLAQSFFAIMVSLALFTSPWWRAEKRSIPEAARDQSPFVQLALMTTVTVFIQLILGALMRHTESGLAVPDFPLAYGQIFPSLNPAALQEYNQQLINANLRLVADDSISSAQIMIHMLHRMWSLVVSVMIIATSVGLLRRARVERRFSRFAYSLLLLLALQLTLGALTIITAKAVDVTTAHVVTGSLLLVSCVLLSLHTVRIYGFRTSRQPVLVTTHEVIA